MHLLLALLATSNPILADDIGLDAIPEQPDSKHASWSRRAFRDGFPDEIPAPTQLVPWNYERHQRATGVRYYDEHGNVYRGDQAAEILDRCDACDDDMDDYHRYDRAARGWSVGTVVSALVFWPGVLLCAPIEIVKVRQAQREFGQALETYNETSAGAQVAERGP